MRGKHGRYECDISEFCCINNCIWARGWLIMHRYSRGIRRADCANDTLLLFGRGIWPLFVCRGCVAYIALFWRYHVRLLQAIWAQIGSVWKSSHCPTCSQYIHCKRNGIRYFFNFIGFVFHAKRKRSMHPVQWSALHAIKCYVLAISPVSQPKS